MYQLSPHLPVLDHIKRGKDCHWWVFPPKLDKKTILEPFGGSENLECLISMCDSKLGELLERQREVKQTFRDNVGYIKSVAEKENWDEISLYFWLKLEAVRASELIYIKHWLRYWLKIVDIAQVAMNKPSLFIKKEGQISDEDIIRAKEYPIVDLYNGDLKQSYQRYVGLCPFHNEKTPSFTIFENNRYFCFGCGAKGSAIDFIMKTRNLNFVEAVKELCALN